MNESLFENETMTYDEPNPTCPYDDCGASFEASREDQDDGERTCPKCGRKFWLQIDYTASYTSFRQKGEAK